MTQPELSVVVPCFNEEATIAMVASAVLAECRERRWQLIVVDDGSTDRSVDRLQPLLAPDWQLIRHGRNRGYGAAVKSGIRAADGAWVVTLDADGQHHIADLARLWRRARAEKADLVVGSRQGMPEASACRKFAKAVIRKFAGLVVPGNPVYDINSGMRLCRREAALAKLDDCPNGMSFCDIMVLLFVRDGGKVLEEPIQIRPRQGGTSSASLLTALETLYEIANIIKLLKR